MNKLNKLNSFSSDNVDIKRIKLDYYMYTHLDRTYDCYNIIYIVRGCGLINGTKLNINDIYIQPESDIFKAFEDKTVILLIKIHQKNTYFYGKEKFNLYDIKPMNQFKLMEFVPQTVYNLLAPPNLRLIIGPKPVFKSIDYHVRGPDKFIMTIVKLKYGEGAIMHKHTISTEIFIVLKGRVKVEFGTEYQILDRFHYINVPTGVYRRFVNIGEEDALLMPIVIGANDESKDIVFKKSIKNNLKLYHRFLLFMSEKVGLLNFE